MRNILTINGGSSSVRFAIFAAEHPPRRLLQGKLERIGSEGTELIVDPGAGGAATHIKVESNERRTAAVFLLDWLESQPVFKSIGGVGHRVVHGMQHTEPERVTAML